MKRKLFLAFFILFLLVFIGSAVGVGLVLHGYRQADVLYDDLQDRYVAPAAPRTPSRPTAGNKPTVEPSEEPVQPEPEPESAPIAIDFLSLLQENGDVVGWLYCEDTPINYPVVQSADNEDYLHRDLYGKRLSSGTLFVDYRCDQPGPERNHILYGHNMKNGTMFGTLVNYKEQAYYDEHPVLYYLTPEGDYKLELFAGLVTKSDSEVYRTRFQDAAACEDFLQTLRESSTFRSDVSVTGEDSIVTLSTCSYEFNNARYVVFGKLTALT